MAYPKSAPVSPAPEAGRRIDLLRALNAAAASLQRSAHSEAAVFQAFRDQIGELGLRGSLVLLNAGGDRLVFRAVAFPGPQLAYLEKLTGLRAEGYSFDVSQAHVYRAVLETGQARFMPDTGVSVSHVLPGALRPLVDRILRVIGRMPGVLAPIACAGRVGGVLIVSGAGVVEADVPTVEAFAHHVSVALDNARLFAAAERRAREWALLDRVRTAIADAIELPVVLRTVVEAIAETFGYTLVSLYLLEGDALVLQHQVGYARTIPHIPVSRGITGRVARTGQPVLLADVRADPAFLGAIDGIVSEVCVPLVDDGCVVGVLNVESTSGVTLAEADLQLMTGLSQHIAIAISRARLYAEARRSEAKYRTLVDNSIQGVMIIQDDRLVYANPAMARITGYTVEELAGSSIDDMLAAIHPDDRLDMLERIRARQGGRPLSSSSAFRLVHRDGHTLWLESFTSEIEYQGRPALLSIALDVTERRQADARLRTQNEYLGVLHETSLGLINRLDLHDLLRAIVSRASALLGTPHGFICLLAPGGEEMERRVGVGVFNHDRGPRLKPGEGLTGQVWQAGLPLVVNDYAAWPDRVQGGPGSIQSMAGVPLRSGVEVIGVLAVASDQASRREFGDAEVEVLMRFAALASIALDNARLFSAAQQELHERQLAEEALRASEDRFRTLLQNAYDMITIHAADGTVLYESPSAERTLGYGPSGLVGKNAFDLVHPQDQARARNSFAGVLDGLEPGGGTPTEVRVRRADGSWITLEVVGRNLLDHPGIRGIVLTSRDITERRHAEEALRYAQKMDSLGVLAGGVAHDFNNLLVALLGQTSLALSQLSIDHPARVPVEKAVKAAERASDLTRQMLAYSGRGPLDIRPVDLNELIRDNLHLCEVAVPKHVRLEARLGHPLPMIDGDAGQLQQVVMNLIGNAAEAIGERPGRILVATGAREVGPQDNDWWKFTGEPLAPGRYALLEVGDDGSGIDADTLAHIFDPFFTTKFTGRGLGLAAVLGIVRGHHGGLTVDSTPEAGTTFRLVFPAASPEESGKQAEEGLPAVELALSPLVLVIDDEEPVRDAVSDILGLEGLSVIVAHDGRSGIEAYREQQASVRLVLLDLSMPGLTGAETFAELRRINPDVQVVVSSGYDQMDATRRISGQGLAGFIQKPYDASTLIRKVREFLG